MKKILKTSTDAGLAGSVPGIYDGIPSVDELKLMLKKHYKSVEVFESWEIKYALSKSSSKEVLLVAKNEID